MPYCGWRREHSASCETRGDSARFDRRFRDVGATCSTARGRALSNASSSSRLVKREIGSRASEMPKASGGAGERLDRIHGWRAEGWSGRSRVGARRSRARIVAVGCGRTTRHFADEEGPDRDGALAPRCRGDRTASARVLAKARRGLVTSRSIRKIQFTIGRALGGHRGKM